MNLLKALVLYVSISYPKKKQNSMIRNVHKAVLLLQVLRIAIRRKWVPSRFMRKIICRLG